MIEEPTDSTANDADARRQESALYSVETLGSDGAWGASSRVRDTPAEGAQQLAEHQEAWPDREHRLVQHTTIRIDRPLPDGAPVAEPQSHDEHRRAVAALRASEALLQRQIDEQAKEIDRLRDEVNKLNSSDWKMDPWMQERFRKRARQWGDACLIVEVAQDRNDPYVDIDDMAEALGLDEDDAKDEPASEDEFETETADVFTPPAHYLDSNGVECCVHTIPVGPDSCRVCRELADEEGS